MYVLYSYMQDVCNLPGKYTHVVAGTHFVHSKLSPAMICHWAGPGQRSEKMGTSHPTFVCPILAYHEQFHAKETKNKQANLADSSCSRSDQVYSILRERSSLFSIGSCTKPSFTQAMHFSAGVSRMLIS